VIRFSTKLLFANREAHDSKVWKSAAPVFHQPAQNLPL
jgi:hypothetical protein